MTGWRWYLPWPTSWEQSTAYDGNLRWVARAVWGPCVAQRWSRSRTWAIACVLKGVVFWRLLRPFSMRWMASQRYVYPRWYRWLVD